MGCYLCGGEKFELEFDRVRDNPSISVLRCQECSLVFLSSFAHITSNFYETSGMHGGQRDIDDWMLETAVDDQRRFKYCRPLIAGKKVLDFGCGNGGFLIRARELAETVVGVDLEKALVPHFEKQQIRLYSSLADLNEKFEVITLFHVLEHSPDPKALLLNLSCYLAEEGQVIIEVPNADDALLRLYSCKEFKEFTYWSCHLFLFNATTLGLLFEQIGARLLYIKHIQRYPVSNHLHWLACGQPGGHVKWNFLNSAVLHEVYESQLASLRLTDTLIARLCFDKS